MFDAAEISAASSPPLLICRSKAAIVELNLADARGDSPPFILNLQREKVWQTQIVTKCCVSTPIFTIITNVRAVAGIMVGIALQVCQTNSIVR